MATAEGHGAAQEADACLGLLIVQHLDIGEPGGVIDADVDELPARAAGTGALPDAPDPVSGAVGYDPPELLDVDVDQLARS